MNKNPNNKKVYKSKRAVNTSRYKSNTARVNNTVSNDTTRVIPTVKNQEQHTQVYTHDPNQLYKKPINSSSDTNNTEESTRVIPKVAPRPQQQQPLPPKRVNPNQTNATGNHNVVRRSSGNLNQATVQRNVKRRPNSRPRPKKKYESEKESAAPGVISNVMKAVIYIVSVVIISIFASVFIIAVGNDVFAFVKKDIEMDIAISEYDNTADIAKKLYDYGVIKYPNIFRLYAKLRHKDDNYVGGTYTISPSMNYDQLFTEFKGKNVGRAQISLTIREGWTVDDIIDLFVSNGMGTRAGFIDVINNYDFDYWFVEKLTDLPASRTYRLEGYLFPDTYYFYTDASEMAIIDKFLSNFNRKFQPEWIEYVEGTNYTLDEMIILASMIEAEGKSADEYGNISSVFHNRLNNPTREAMGFLQSDATIQYVLAERITDSTQINLSEDSEYNTYIYIGLPPGPIGNPSLNAIHFALEPYESNYFYFIADNTGKTHFYETHTEHELKKAEIRNSQ